MFTLSESQYKARPFDERSRTARFYPPDNPALAEGLLKLLLDRAWLKCYPANRGGIVIIPLEGWQINILETFGIVSKNECTDKNRSRR